MKWKSLNSTEQKKESKQECWKKTINEIVVEWSSNWRFSYKSVIAVFVMIVVRRLSFVFAVAIFSFHFSTRSIYVRMLPKWRTNSTPRTDNFPTHRATVPPCMVEAVALPWFVCNVFFIIAISFIWCCLDSWWRDHTLTLRWNGKREKSPRLLTLDVVVACWNQDKCFPSTTMCLYNSSTKLSLLCSNFSTFPHISVGCVCVCVCVPNVLCMWYVYVFFAGSTSQTHKIQQI